MRHCAKAVPETANKNEAFAEFLFALKRASESDVRSRMFMIACIWLRKIDFWKDKVYKFLILLCDKVWYHSFKKSQDFLMPVLAKVKSTEFITMIDKIPK